MPATEFNPRNMVVRTLNHCPALEEPPAPLGALEPEQAPPSATELIDMLEQQCHQWSHGLLTLSTEPPQPSPELQVWSLLHLQGLR